MLSTLHVDLSVFHVVLPWQRLGCVTFDSVICMSTVQRAHCCVSMDTVFTRTRHHVTLHIHFLALNLTIPCIFIPAYIIYLPTKCTFLIITNVKCVSATCFGTCVPFSGRTQYQFLKTKFYCTAVIYRYLGL
jgi:hypothetical protein